MSSENGSGCPVRICPPLHGHISDITDKPGYTSFKEWNGNEEVAKTASELYGGDIDRLELYPGLHAEGIVGDGLGVEYSPVRVNTMRNGLLLDAVALVNSSHHGLLSIIPDKM